MLKGKLLHPDILQVLGRAGHGSQILISDGNFPSLSALAPGAQLISLNLSPGIVSCTAVLEAIAATAPIEAAAVMDYHREGPYALDADPPIERFAFYEAARGGNVVATIQTAEQRLYANLLLTIGVIMPEATD